MFKAKTLVSLFILVLAVPGIAQAGLHLYPADGPAPQLQIEKPKPLEYKIKRGDTVAGIAKKFSVSAKDLMKANGMTDPRKLRAGKMLMIPGKTAPVPAVAATARPKPVVAVSQAKPVPAAATSGKAGVAATPGTAGKSAATPPKKPSTETAPASCALGASAHASFGKTGVITNSTDVPQAIRDEFFQYAIKWVDDLEKFGVGTRANKKIHKVGNQWVASYRVIQRESLGAEVKRVHYEHTPYVGHITYTQRIYTATGPTKQAALAGPYTQKDEAIREIFSYSGKKKAWR